MADPDSTPVGITKGPGETIHEYTSSRGMSTASSKTASTSYHITRSTRATRAPVMVSHRDRMGTGGPARQVLGRILQRVPVQLYPDSFLSEPSVSPSAGGRDGRATTSCANDLFELHVAIMGYFDAALGSFVNPWIPPESGMPIYPRRRRFWRESSGKQRAGGSAARTSARC